MKPIYLEKSLGIDIREESVAITQLGKQLRKIKVLGCHFLKIAPFGEENQNSENAFLDDINRLLMQHDTTWDHIVISFPRRFITLKTFSLPAPNRKAVDSMIEFELERHFAAGPEDLYFSFQAKEKANNQFLIALFAIKQEIADYYFNLLQRVNLKPTVLEVSTPCNLKFIQPKQILENKLIAILDLSSNNIETSILKEGHIEYSRNHPIEDPEYREAYFENTVSEDSLEEIAEGFSHIIIQEIQTCLAGCPNVEDNESLEYIYIFGGGNAATHLTRLLENQTQVPSSKVLPNLEYESDKPTDIPIQNLSTAFGLSLRELQTSEFDMNLIPPNLRPKKKKFNIRTTLAMAAGVVLLSIGVFAAKIIHNNVTLSSLETQLNGIKSKIGALEKIDLEFENLKRLVTIFNTIDEREPLKLPVIEELTQIIPKDTWLTGISIIKNKIEIKGFSASAAKLIPIIENSSYFTDAVFNGSIVRQEEKDKFTIRASIGKESA